MTAKVNLTWYLLVADICDTIPSLPNPTLQYSSQIHQLEDNHLYTDTSYQIRIPAKTRACALQRTNMKNTQVTDEVTKSIATPPPPSPWMGASTPQVDPQYLCQDALAM